MCSQKIFFFISQTKRIIIIFQFLNYFCQQFERNSKYYIIFKNFLGLILKLLTRAGKPERTATVVVIQFPSGVVPLAEMAGFTPCMGICWMDLLDLYILLDLLICWIPMHGD